MDPGFHQARESNVPTFGWPRGETSLAYHTPSGPGPGGGGGGGYGGDHPGPPFWLW